jgi:hypothetical protein
LNIIFYETAILTASILRIYVTWQGTNEKLPDDEMEMSETCRSKYYIKRCSSDIYCCDINLHLFVVIKILK